MIYKRNCPKCNSEIQYMSTKSLNAANKNSSKCKECYNKQKWITRNINHPPINTTITYKRNCPECDIEIEYKHRRSFKKGEKNNTPCRKCYSKKTSKTLKGVPTGRKRRKDSDIEKKYFRGCTECNKPIGYSTEKLLKRSISNNTICNSCNNYKHKKTWNDIITEDHIKQMRATKAGFKDFDEYVKKYPKKQMYKLDVWRLTYRHDLTTLEHWEKRGKCGVSGAYQLDHIYPISAGYENNIPPAELAKVENLRMIPWRQNLLKSNKITKN